MAVVEFPYVTETPVACLSTSPSRMVSPRNKKAHSFRESSDLSLRSLLLRCNNTAGARVPRCPATDNGVKEKEKESISRPMKIQSSRRRERRNITPCLSERIEMPTDGLDSDLDSSLVSCYASFASISKTSTSCADASFKSKGGGFRLRECFSSSFPGPFQSSPLSPGNKASKNATFSVPAPKILNGRRAATRQRSSSVNTFRAHATCLQRGGSKHACVVKIDSHRSMFEVSVPSPSSQYNHVSLILTGDNCTVDLIPGTPLAMVVSIVSDDEPRESKTHSFNLVFSDSYSVTRMVFQLYSLRSRASSLNGLVHLASACVLGNKHRASADPSFCPTFFKLHANELSVHFPTRVNLLLERIRDAAR